MDRETSRWPFVAVILMVLGGCAMGIPGNSNRAEHQIDTLLKSDRQAQQVARMEQAANLAEKAHHKLDAKLRREWGYVKAAD